MTIAYLNLIYAPKDDIIYIPLTFKERLGVDTETAD